ncbi:MAG: methyltransferase domain-containing protein [Deltaproteobacteria bacterium]|nr:methyltransferase domain-containing protein [Deltaproteobacteria bacterium]
MDKEKWEQAYRGVERDLGARMQKIRAFGFDRCDLRVLDLGCGDGIDMEAFHRLGFLRVIGVDLADSLLRQLDRLRFRVFNADVYAIGMRDASFDVVYGNNVLHHFTQLDRALAEIRRVLRAGGIFCFVEPHRTLFRNLVDRVTLSSLACLAPSLSHRRIILEEEMEDYHNWLKNQDSLPERLARHGFELVACKRGIFRLFGKWRAI